MQDAINSKDCSIVSSLNFKLEIFSIIGTQISSVAPGKTVLSKIFPKITQNRKIRAQRAYNLTNTDALYYRILDFLSTLFTDIKDCIYILIYIKQVPYICEQCSFFRICYHFTGGA